MPTITFTSVWTATLVTAATSTTPAIYSGTLTVTGTTNYAADGISLSNVTEVVTVTGPDLSEYTITINPATSRSGAMVLPQGITGSVQEGDYGLVMASTVIGPTLPGTYTSDAVDFEYCISPISPVLTPTVDCVCAKVTFTDETDYTGVTINSRTITLTPPVYTGIWSPVTTSTLAYVTSAGLDLYKGVYTGTMALNVTKLGIVYVLNVRQTVSVDCKSICEMFCALDTLFAIAQANTSNPALKAQQLNALQLASAYAMMANQSQSCDSANVADLQTAFYQVISPWVKSNDCCDCCTDGDIIQARCGSSQPTSYTFFANPSQYLTVGVVGTAVTYSLTAAAQALLEAVRVYDVVAGDGTVTVTPSGGATAGSTKTFTIISAARQRLSFKYRVTYNGSSGAASYPTLKRSGSVWTLVNPTAADVNIGGLYYLEFSNIVTSIPQNLYVDAHISYQEPIKALQNGNAHNNEVIRVNAFTDNVNGKVYLKFFDLAGTAPVWRDAPIDSAVIYNYVKTLEYTVDIWL